MLKAIETRYKGFRFRSRLEARWATFFDSLGVSWDYELEGFELGYAGRYLPDFRVKSADIPIWIEIKPDTPSPEELRKCLVLNRGGAGPVWLVAGTPGSEHVWIATAGAIVLPSFTDTRNIWCHHFNLCPPDGNLASHRCDRRLAAYNAARSARFEHGERPR